MENIYFWLNERKRRLHTVYSLQDSNLVIVKDYDAFIEEAEGGKIYNNNYEHTHIFERLKNSNDWSEMSLTDVMATIFRYISYNSDAIYDITPKYDDY